MLKTLCSVHDSSNSTMKSYNFLDLLQTFSISIPLTLFWTTNLTNGTTVFVPNVISLFLYPTTWFLFTSQSFLIPTRLIRMFRHSPRCPTWTYRYLLASSSPSQRKSLPHKDVRLICPCYAQELHYFGEV